MKYIRPHLHLAGKTSNGGSLYFTDRMAHSIRSKISYKQTRAIGGNSNYRIKSRGTNGYECTDRARCDGCGREDYLADRAVIGIGHIQIGTIAGDAVRLVKACVQAIVN